MLHLITIRTKSSVVRDATVYLIRAAEDLQVPFVQYDAVNTDLMSLPELSEDDLLYRDATGTRAGLIQRLLLNQHCTHFYEDWRNAHNYRGTSYDIHNKLGLPVIPSVSFIPDTEEQLRRVVDMLGPFPLVMKVRGRSKGVGVIRVDSWESFTSLADYLRTTPERILIRKYIPHTHYGRAVVVGDRVVASHVTYVQDGEFRSNVVINPSEDTRYREAREFSPDVQSAVVQAVRSVGLETGGVDLLFAEDGTAFIAEMNFPNDFSYTQKITGVDIARLMIEHLLHKQAQRS